MRAHIRAVEGVVKGILGRASGSTGAERRGRGVVRWTVRLAGPRGKRRVARMTRGMRRSVVIGAGADPTPCANVLLMMKRMHRYVVVARMDGNVGRSASGQLRGSCHVGIAMSTGGAR